MNRIVIQIWIYKIVFFEIECDTVEYWFQDGMEGGRRNHVIISNIELSYVASLRRS